MSRSKRTRLTDSTEFDRVYKQGVAFRGKLFSVHAFPNDLDTPRLGLSVSRKVGNAVTRNTVRRRLKEVFTSMIDEVPGSLDLVVSARPSAAAASFDELGDEFGRSLRKIAEKGAGRKA